MYRLDNTAFVLGMFETGLGVGRSLGRKGIEVIGIDFKKDIGFYSRYIKARICPHPLDEESDFINFLIQQTVKYDEKPVLFVTSDDFLTVISRNISVLREHFRSNLPSSKIVDSTANKYRQYLMARKVGIPCPETHAAENWHDVQGIIRHIEYPVFIKAKEVNSWRRNISSTIKGFAATDEDQLMSKLGIVFDNGSTAVIQEVIPGPDTNHFKFCCYISNKGDFLLIFTLQKIRQLPIRFGVGSVVMSIDYPDLARAGAKFFRGIGYRGTGSAEFKLDERDGLLKLIELNPRYWQQNSLAEICGMNFPFVDYLEATGQAPHRKECFQKGKKWLNIYMDFKSFLGYWRLGQLKFASWIRSLKGTRVFSDFANDDIVPTFYSMSFLRNISHIQRYWQKALRGN